MMAMTDQEIRERQKDRELEWTRRKLDEARREASQYRDALHQALIAVREHTPQGAQRDALAELLTGYPPAAHTALMFLPAGTVLEHGSFVLARKP
jgi:hypothetical protein